MTILPRCKLCTKYLPVTKEGADVHYRLYHGMKSAAKYVPMAPAVKAEAIAKVESRLREFIVVPEPPARNRCNSCGPTNNDGYWLQDGTGVCDPCVKIGSEAPGVRF